MKKYLVEFVGTFTLSLVVLLAVTSGHAAIAIPVIAGLTLGLFVYTIGSVSGCHINPSVTLGQLSLGKISPIDAALYIAAQLLGGFAAMLLAGYLVTVATTAPAAFSVPVFVAEMLGAFLFNFGIAAVVAGKAPAALSGVVVGGSLLLGILVSSLGGAAGILNPAVALALGSFSLLYILAPVVGAVVGVQLYRYIAAPEVAQS